eukprot:1510761-Prymnesium_polylepis.1
MPMPFPGISPVYPICPPPHGTPLSHLWREGSPHRLHVPGLCYHHVGREPGTTHVWIIRAPYRRSARPLAHAVVRARSSLHADPETIPRRLHSRLRRISNAQQCVVSMVCRTDPR